MAIIKILHHDVETTGRDPAKHAIHQLAGHIEIDGEIVESFDFKVRPHPTAIIDHEALKISGATWQVIRNYPDGMRVMRDFCNLVDKYVDVTNPQDRMFTSAFNGANFDDPFLKQFFEHNGCTKYKGYFFSGCLDTRVLAMNKLSNERATMPTFNLAAVARRFNIDVDEKRLHDGCYDASISRQLLKAINNR